MFGFAIEEVELDEFGTDDDDFDESALVTADTLTEDDDAGNVAKELSEEEKEQIVTAFFRSRNDIGRTSLNDIVSKTGFRKADVIETLEGAYIWKDPFSRKWVTKAELGLGNVREKLKRAEEIYEETGTEYATLKALKELAPAALYAEDIEFSLATPWIPLTFKAMFIKDITDMQEIPIIEQDKIHGRYKIISGTILNDLKNSRIYGTEYFPAVKLIEKILNASPVKLPEWASRDATPELEKQREIEKAFTRWVKENPVVEERLIELYMEKTGYVAARYDGTHIKPKGLNPEVRLYQHQKDVIERIISSGNDVLIAHEVGAGKTYSFEIGVCELLRLELVQKALIVLPNNVLNAAVQTFQYLYPKAEYMAVFPKDFIPKYREEVIRKLKTTDKKIVFMAYSSFDMLTMTKEYYLRKLDQDILRAKAAYNNPGSSRLKRIYETELKKLSEKRYDLIDRPENPTACFEELGFDCLVVDECHNYKNISMDYQINGVFGVHVKGSRKSDELLEKVHDIQAKNGKIIFASGTPAPNSLADIYALQCYLQKSALETMNIHRFSDWTATFCKEEVEFELNASQKYEMKKRISKFHNLPELSALFSNVCDFYRINRAELKLPDDIQEIVVDVKRSDAMAEFMATLLERAEDIHSKAVHRREDNMLKVTLDGRVASVDIRLAVPKAQFTEEESKVYACAKQVKDFYVNYPGKTQIVFCDTSIPKKEFNVYDELKRILMESGIPGEEIAFVHDAASEKKRTELLKKFNEGAVRIMVGSTQKLGTGSNVQKNLVAVHNVDIPWRPSDIEQRTGRMYRQGNTNAKVHVLHYLTKSTYDAFSFQKLEMKQKFIAAFFSGKLFDHRSEDDLEDMTLKYSEMKAAATGNPLVRQRVDLANALQKVRKTCSHRKNDLYRMQKTLQSLPEKIAQCDSTWKQLEADWNYYRDKRSSCSRDERLALAEELIAALKSNIHVNKERKFDTYQGFDVILPKGMEFGEKYVYLRRPGGGSYRMEMPNDQLLGVTMRMDNLLNSLKKRSEAQKDQADAYRRQMEDAKREIEAGNQYAEEEIRLIRELKEIDHLLEVA